MNRIVAALSLVARLASSCSRERFPAQTPLFDVPAEQRLTDGTPTRISFSSGSGTRSFMACSGSGTLPFTIP